jgi:hypothetical protein
MVRGDAAGQMQSGCLAGYLKQVDPEPDPVPLTYVTW